MSAKIKDKSREDHLKDILENQMLKGNVKEKDVKDKSKLRHKN